MHNARQIAKQLAQRGHRTLGRKLIKIKAEGPEWKAAAATAAELGHTAKTLEKHLNNEAEGEAYKTAYAAITDIASVLRMMAYAEVVPKASKQLLKVRELLKPRFSR